MTKKFIAIGRAYLFGTSRQVVPGWFLWGYF